MYTYGTSSDFKGSMVTVIQCSTLNTTTCAADNNRKQSEYHFDVFGRLRKQRIRDFNPFVSGAGWFTHNGAAEKWRETSYSYYKNGNTALIIEPSGKTTQYIYDSRSNLARQVVYPTNPFAPNYIVPVLVKLDGNFKFLKDQTATFTAKVRDAANAGVTWQIKQGTTVLWDSNNTPLGNGYAAGPVYATGTDADFKTYTLTFGTPGSFYNNANTEYTVVAISKTDTRKYAALNYVVTPKISAVNLTLPTRLVVVPGCVEGGGTSYQCPPGIYRNELNIFGSLTPTPGFSISDYRISGTVTAVTAASTQAPTLLPSQFTITTRSSSISIQPPAWSASLQGHSYTLSVTANSVEDPTVTTGNFNLVVNYMGIITRDMARDIRFNPSVGPWNSYLSSSNYQHKASIINPPTASALGISWSASSGGYFSSTNNGCFRSGDMGIFDGPKAVTITASVAQYPQVSMTYNDAEFFTLWDNFNGCNMSEVNATNGYYNNIYGAVVTYLNSNGNQVRSLHSLSAPNAASANGFQATNNNPQTFQTNTIDEPEFPSDVQPGSIRDSQVSYNLDNMLNVQNQPANGTYGAVTQTHAYTYHSTSIGGQNFQTVSQHRTTTNVAGADKRNTLEEYDTKGRLTRFTKTAGAISSVKTLSYANDGTQAFDVYSPNPIGATKAGIYSGVNSPLATQYGDQTNTITTDGEETKYRYDMLGNVVWESCYKCYTKNVARATDGTLTSTDFDRATYRTFNGYGQQVWNAVYSNDGIVGGGPNDSWESIKLTRYYSTGEIDASFDGSAKNLTVYQYDETPTSTNFGRFWKVKKGPDDNNDGVLDSEREITDVSYDSFGRVSSSGTNGLVTSYKYDTLDRFTQSNSGAPENRFVYRTYSPSGTPDYDCTGDGVGGTFTYCQYKAVDSLGRVTAINHLTNAAQSESGKTGWMEYITYDEFDRPLTSTDERLEMNGTADDRMTKMKYDNEGRLLMLVGPRLRTNTGNGYTDSRRSAVAYTYDDMGRKTKEAVALNGLYNITDSIPDSDAAINTYSYNNWDRVVSSVDPRGFTTSMAYDEIGNLINQKRQVTATTYATTTTAYDAMGRPTMLIDPLGNISRNTYDILGNKTRFTDARGITTKVYAYTGDGLLEKVYEPVVQIGYTNADAGAGLDPSTLAKYVMTKRYKYSTTSKYPTAECSPYLTSDASTDVNCTTKTNDAMGRVTQDTLSDGGIITRAYDINNNVTSLTDADGFTTTYSYDAFKRLRSTTQQARTGAGLTTDTAAGLSAGITSTYGYDLMGNLTSKVERGLTTKYQYNSLGKVIAETRAHKAATVTAPLYKKYTYRIDGARTAETNFSYAGDLSNYASNAPKISTGTGTPTITEGNIQIFELDAIGNMIAESSKGKASDGTMLLEKVATYTYNGLNLKVTRDFNGHEAIYQAQRNPDGKFRLTTTNGDPLNPAGAMNTRVYTIWQYDLNKHLTYKADSLAPDLVAPFNTFGYSYTETGNVLASSRDVKVKIPAFQNDVNLGATVTLAATNGYLQGVYNSRDMVWQVNVEDYSADGLNSTGQRYNTITQNDYYVNGIKSSATVLNWDGGGTATGTKGSQTFSYDKRGRETSRTDTNGAQDLRELPAGSTSPRKPIVGTATITNTFTAGNVTTKLTDSTGKCRYQRDIIVTVGERASTTKEWDWDPNPGAAGGLQYDEVVCGTTTPTRATTIKYDVQGNSIEQNLVSSGTRYDTPRPTKADSSYKVTSSSTYKQTYTYDNYGIQSETQLGQFNATGTSTVPVYICRVGPTIPGANTTYPATFTTPLKIPYLDSSCSYKEVTVQPGAVIPSVTTYEYVWSNDVTGPYTENAQQTKVIVPTITADGFQTSKSTTITQTPGSRFTPSFQTADPEAGTISYVTDSRGYRMKVFGGKYSNYIKRLDADDQPAMFFRWEGSSAQPYAMYNDFRYDPSGQDILTSTGGLKQNSSDVNNPFTIVRDASSQTYLNGELQVLRKRAGNKTKAATTEADLIKDATYSAAEGSMDGTIWTGVVLFSVENTSNPLEAPTTPLSVTTNVDPSSVTAPNQGTPNIDPTPITPPTGKSEPSSNPSASSSSQAEQSNDTGFGVTFMILSTPTNTSDTAFSSENALTNPVTNNSNAVNQSTSFQVQTLNLEPPSSVLPATLSSLNALDISSPQSALDTPIVGLPDPTTVLAPNPTNVPTVGSTPSDSPSTIQAPSSVTSVLPPSIGNIPVGSIDVPTLTGEPGVNLFDANDDNAARYMEWKANFERYFSSIIESLIRTHQLTEAKLGEALRNIANVMSVFLIDYTKKYNPSQLEMVTTTISVIRQDFSDPLEQVMILFDYSAAVHMAPSSRPAQGIIVQLYIQARLLHVIKHGGSDLDAAHEFDKAQRRVMELGYGAGNFYDPGMFKTLLNKGNGHITAENIKQYMIYDAFDPFTSHYGQFKSEGEKYRAGIFETAKAGFELVLLGLALAAGIAEIAGAVMVIVDGVIQITGLSGAALLHVQAIYARWANSQRTFGIVPRGFSSPNSGNGITIAEANAVAQRNGIDTRKFELRINPNPLPNSYGNTPGTFPSASTDLMAPMRAASGRPIIELSLRGLSDERTALATIAHELNHLRGLVNSGIYTSEEAAEKAAQAALQFFR